MSNEYRTPDAGRGPLQPSRDVSAAPTAVLFSGGLDSAVLVADAARTGPVRALYVSVGFAWEAEERAMAARLFASPPFAGVVDPPVDLQFDMRDVFPATHWAVRGEPPAFDTPDEDVYLDGRNVILVSKAAVYIARAASAPTSPRLRRDPAVALRAKAGTAAAPGHTTHVLLGTLAGNPFPDATSAFFAAMSRALSLGLGTPLAIEAPFAALHKADVIRKGIELGVPLALTLSCMQPKDGLHCGRCSKCRERRDAFREAGVDDPTAYREKPLR
jgi:7-cyano-7-deazaguanine synthase